MLSQIECRDVARREAEELLRESEERYALAARGANDGLWDWKLSSGKSIFLRAGIRCWVTPNGTAGPIPKNGSA